MKDPAPLSDQTFRETLLAVRAKLKVALDLALNRDQRREPPTVDKR